MSTYQKLISFVLVPMLLIPVIMMCCIVCNAKGKINDIKEDTTKWAYQMQPSGKMIYSPIR